MRGRETMIGTQVLFSRSEDFLPPRSFVVERDQFPKSKSGSEDKYAEFLFKTATTCAGRTGACCFDCLQYPETSHIARRPGFPSARRGPCRRLGLLFSLTRGCRQRLIACLRAEDLHLPTECGLIKLRYPLSTFVRHLEVNDGIHVRSSLSVDARYLYMRRRRSEGQV